MRVLILGGTRFIGRRIALELLARGDDVMVVHRGQTEPAELSGCAHAHVSRTALVDVEPLCLARGGGARRLSLIYGEHDGQRREEFVLRRVRAGRLRIPFGAGTSLDTRCYVGDVASAVLAALDNASVAAGQVFNNEPERAGLAVTLPLGQ